MQELWQSAKNLLDWLSQAIFAAEFFLGVASTLAFSYAPYKSRQPRIEIAGSGQGGQDFEGTNLAVYTVKFWSNPKFLFFRLQRRDAYISTVRIKTKPGNNFVGLISLHEFKDEDGNPPVIRTAQFFDLPILVDHNRRIIPYPGKTIRNVELTDSLLENEGEVIFSIELIDTFGSKYVFDYKARLEEKRNASGGYRFQLRKIRTLRDRARQAASGFREIWHAISSRDL